MDDYTAQIQHRREHRIEYFSSDPRSPIPSTMQGEAFPGLAYFDVDRDYRFEIPLHEHDEHESITVETSADGQQTYLVWGDFEFEVDGETHSLQAYRSDPAEDRLWVPFRDETSGEETYGAGRYLDLEPDDHRVGNEWVLDFNLAYNPTCAYNEAYECPLVPMENWLDVRIEAGEKDFPGEPVSPHAHD